MELVDVAQTAHLVSPPTLHCSDNSFSHKSSSDIPESVNLRNKKLCLAIKLQESIALGRLANQTLALSSQKACKNSLSGWRACLSTNCAAFRLKRISLVWLSKVLA